MPVLKGLGFKHMEYHVKPEHYVVVGASFLETLADGLGSAFTEKHKEAYTKMWTVVQTTMLSGAEEKTN